MSYRVALITVVYQNYTVLKDLFESLEKQSNKNFHVFISDLSNKKQKIEAGKLPITVINGENKGYAYGINLGLKKAMKENFNLFCVINNDTFLKNNFIDSVLTSILNHPSLIIGGKIYYAPGYEYHKKRYTQKELGSVIWYAGGSIDWNNMLVKHHQVDEIDDKKNLQPAEIDFISGCLMIFDKAVIESVGYWDEDYFLYYEDADYCVRAQKKGLKLYYDPSIIMWHKNAQSTEGSGSTLHQKYQEKNRLQFALKYAPLRTKIHLLKNYFFKL